MKTYNICLYILVLLLLFSVNSFSQHGYYRPDSLTEVLLSGKVIIDSTTIHKLYYLDVNSDEQPEYLLNFGPYWYQSDSSAVTRPQNGDSVTIKGGLYNNMMSTIKIVVVYEINGGFWRNPYDPKWNYLGNHSHASGHHMEGCNGFAFGWMHQQPAAVNYSGIALVDTTLYFNQYYLDMDKDSLPDYFLNFGPYWYEPTSGAQRPLNGDSIRIIGGQINNSIIPMLVIYNINGFEWRDSSLFMNGYGSNWMHRNMLSSIRIHSPFDTLDWMQVNPGWNMGMGGHGLRMMPDSLYAQMLELYPHNIPNRENQNILAGYEIGLFNGNGSNSMWQSGSCGNHMNFANMVQFQAHYSDKELFDNRLDEDNVRVKYWDNQLSAWQIIDNALVNASSNTVAFSSDEISNFIILTADNATSLNEDTDYSIIKDYTLKQNYPNPFNPVTKIIFTISQKSFVILKVYDVLGNEITTLINEEKPSGYYEINFNAQDLPSGVYFYTMKAGNFAAAKKCILMK